MKLCKRLKNKIFQIHEKKTKRNQVRLIKYLTLITSNQRLQYGRFSD